MRGGRFLSCRHGAIGVVHLVVVHGPGHGVDFSGIQEKGKKKIQRFVFIILGEKKKSARQPGVRFFSRLHNLKKHFDHTGTRVPTLNNMICASSSIF